MKLFGTDGIRGIVNQDLTVLLAMKLGAAVARIKQMEMKKKATFLVGSDTRISKDMIKCAIIGGVLSEGAHVIDLGVLPTPAISYLVSHYHADGAFVISASHNPSEYNGIKVLNELGFKLSETLEEKIEDCMLNDFEFNHKVNDCGQLTYHKDGLDVYVKHLISTIDHDIHDVKILVDVANGAAYETAECLFSSLNANYTIIHHDPNGLNINENCGSTHINFLQEQVVQGAYDIGIAYDGDADRCILVDENGTLIDGDFILAIYANDLKKSNRLKKNTVVGTIMSNLGFIKFCEEQEIQFVATKVGDKYVLENMIKNDYILGGEQSGHIIFKDFANTGDGELTSLQILNIMAKENKKLSELASIMRKYPQVMINVAVSKDGKEKFYSNQEIQNKIDEITNLLNGDGRIVIRPSGTENLIRVMLEGSNKEVISNYCQELASFIENKLK